MNLYGRCVLTAVIFLLGYVVLVQGLRLLNRPSDWSLYVGIGVLFALVALMPLVIRSVWSKR